MTGVDDRGRNGDRMRRTSSKNAISRVKSTGNYGDHAMSEGGMGSGGKVGGVVMVDIPSDRPLAYRGHSGWQVALVLAAIVVGVVLIGMALLW